MKKLESVAYKLAEEVMNLFRIFWANGNTLWIWYCYATILTSVLFFLKGVLALPLIVSSMMDLGLMGIEPFVSMSLLSLLQVVNVALVVAVMKNLKQKDPTGINQAAGSLALSFVAGNWFVMLFGFAVFLSEGFRRFAESWAPGWYKALVHALFETRARPSSK
ncbi:MAG: hypothetical protein HRT45_14795 [Bdellovibrionales bacterium]|nr:hypothetical protein [Bdellovibrionales bacterium]